MGAEGRSETQGDLPPIQDLARYLGIIRRALVLIRNFGVNQEETEPSYYGHLADALHNLPEMLLHFGRFDEGKFWADVEFLRQSTPPGLEGAWRYVFEESA